MFLVKISIEPNVLAFYIYGNHANLCSNNKSEGVIVIQVTNFKIIGKVIAHVSWKNNLAEDFMSRSRTGQLLIPRIARCYIRKVSYLTQEICAG